MLNRLQEIRQQAEQAIDKARDLKNLDELKVQFLGRKGEITSVLRSLKDLAESERAQVGQMANQLKTDLEQLLEDKIATFKQQETELRLRAEKIDITLPGVPVWRGGKHPLTLVIEEIEDIFASMGYVVEEGPEIETDYYNFEAMNIPKDHPAREMQDSFYITDEILLRTHTSPMQARTMEKYAPQLPIRIISPGKVYRRDDDATHSPMFQQVEGLWVDKNVTFADLKGTLMNFARRMFSLDLDVRYRPSFFSFTEPSVEMDISCVNCGGKGCRVCSHTGWLEILGAGMVNPRVLAMGGYDPERVSGFAFGMGVERITMLKYGVNDLRLFFDNDLRFLKQF